MPETEDTRCCQNGIEFHNRMEVSLSDFLFALDFCLMFMIEHSNSSKKLNQSYPSQKKVRRPIFFNCRIWQIHTCSSLHSFWKFVFLDFAILQLEKYLLTFWPLESGRSLDSQYRKHNIQHEEERFSCIFHWSDSRPKPPTQAQIWLLQFLWKLVQVFKS